MASDPMVLREFYDVLVAGKSGDGVVFTRNDGQVFEGKVTSLEEFDESEAMLVSFSLGEGNDEEPFFLSEIHDVRPL